MNPASRNDNSEHHHIHVNSKSNFTDIQFDPLHRGSSMATTEAKTEKSFSNAKDIYDIYSQKKETKEENCIYSFLSSITYSYFKITLIVLFLLLSVTNLVFNEKASIELVNIVVIIDLAILLFFFVDSLTNMFISYICVGLNWIFFEFLVLFMFISFYAVLVGFHLYHKTSSDNYITIFGFIRLVRVILLVVLYRYYLIIPTTEIDKPAVKKEENDLSMPIDKIISVLNLLREKIPSHEKNLITDLEYCIEMISRNKIFSPNIFNDKANIKTQSEEVKRIKEEICFWIQNFARFEQEISNKNTLDDVEIRCETPKMLMKEMTDNPSEMQDRMASVFPNLNPQNIIQCFKNVYSDSFNVFLLKDATNDQELVAIMYFLFYNNDLLKIFNMRNKKFINFCKKIQANYRKNPYHNSAHATDVVQTIHYYMTICNMNTVLKMTNLETAALLLGAMVHDVDHPGKGNAYLISTNSELAINYNDKSVLENHHISFTFKILSDKEFNIFENLTPGEYKQIRKLMISIVLCTDLASHFYELGNFKGRVTALSENNFSNIPDEDRLCFLSNAVHFADISNQTKNWEICFKWTEYLYDEFFAQGDEERSQNIPLGFLNDRFKTNIGQAQVSFIEKFIVPSFEAFAILLPKAISLCEMVDKNKKRWQELIEQYDIKLKELEREKDKLK